MAVAAAVALAAYLIYLYNLLVQRRNRAANSWAQIDVELKRRHELVPGLVQAVAAYAAHEQALLDRIAAARSAALGAGADPGRRGPPEGRLGGELHRLLAVAERYPDLKADAGFQRLQADLAETENRIAFARQFYNETTMMYNTDIGRFPANLLARLLGFRDRPFFELGGEVSA